MPEQRVLKSSAEDIAVRQPCQDFEDFEPTFAAVKADPRNGVRQARHFERKSEIEPGRFFIVEGLMAYVAEAGEAFINESGNRDMRLRVIFDNGTESNLLARSLQKALTQDPAGRRITEPNAGPLFDQEVNVEGNETGTIYVLRSRSGHPKIAQNRELIHKIGVTGGDVERRIANAERDPTFLLAPVEIVATYRLIDINRTALENLLHRFFADARLDIAIPDRFGDRIEPREWFLVPLHVVDEVVRHLQDGTLHAYAYDLATASLRPSARITWDTLVVLVAGHHSTGNGMISADSVAPSGCRFSGIASTMSEASMVNRQALARRHRYDVTKSPVHAPPGTPGA